MPSPEHIGEDRGKEREPIPYYQAASFKDENPAARAYFQVQETLFRNPDCDLSVFRIQLVDHTSHVVVLGDLLAQELEQKLVNVLAAGELTPLHPDVLKALQERRAQAIKKGPWVEGHYRPGKLL